MDGWNKVKKEILKDPEVRKYYDDMEAEYRVISDLIKLRKAKKINQEQLAERMGTTQSALSRFEAGGTNVSMEFLKRIAKALDKKLEIRFV
jgi:predicted transcriptional regulator